MFQTATMFMWRAVDMVMIIYNNLRPFLQKSISAAHQMLRAASKFALTNQADQLSHILAQ